MPLPKRTRTLLVRDATANFTSSTPHQDLSCAAVGGASLGHRVPWALRFRLFSWSLVSALATPVERGEDPLCNPPSHPKCQMHPFCGSQGSGHCSVRTLSPSGRHKKNQTVFAPKRYVESTILTKMQSNFPKHAKKHKYTDSQSLSWFSTVSVAIFGASHICNDPATD